VCHQLVMGDLRSTAFGEADVVVMLDVLHYIEPEAQSETLRRAREDGDIEAFRGFDRLEDVRLAAWSQLVLLGVNGASREGGSQENGGEQGFLHAEMRGV